MTTSKIQGEAKGGLQLFAWRIIQKSINNKTRINPEFYVLTTVNLLLPHPGWLYLERSVGSQPLLSKMEILAEDQEASVQCVPCDSEHFSSGR